MIVEKILQNVIVPNPRNDIRNIDQLYFRTEFPRACVSSSLPVTLNKYELLRFDTYINSFSLSKWITYTALNNLHLTVEFSGKLEIKLFHFWMEPNNRITQEILETELLESEHREKRSFELTFENPVGMVAFSVRSLEDGSTFFRGCYSTKIDESLVNPVKLALGICTYKREQYVKRNICELNEAFFSNESSELKGNLEVFISDNARTLDKADFSFPEIHVFPNKNAGGSGGFTRTMIEVNRANDTGAGFTHIVLMDDDIQFDAESVFRTYALLSLITRQYKDAFVGGAMFFIERPCIQHASGEHWCSSENRIISYNLDLDMRRLEHILSNDAVTDADHQAWWYCAMPISTCGRNNLSLPLFIKFDDIEYSLRNLKELILLNGIFVWHESFDSKYSVANQYYWYRNLLITSAIHGEHSAKDVRKYVRDRLLLCLANFNYNEFYVFEKGVRDYLSGVDYLKQLDPEENHKSLSKYNCKMIDISEIPEYSEGMFERTMNTPYPSSRIKRALRILTLNGMLLPSNKVIAVSVWGGSRFHTYRAKKIIGYEPVVRKGFVSERSMSEFIKCSTMYLKLDRNLRRNYIRAKDEYRERYGELINEDFWKEKLGIE